MKVCYISGPYRNHSVNGIYANIQLARSEALKWWQKGYAVICPHMNTAFMDGECPDTVWLAGDLELVRRSDIIVMLPGYEESQGALSELEMAQKHHLEIIYNK